MATLTAQQIARTGLDPAYSFAAAGGDQFAHTPDVFIHVKNGDASPHTVTVASQRPASVGYSVSGLVVSVPAGGERMIGPLPEAAYKDSDGNVQLTYDAVTSVTLAVLKP